MDQPRWGESGLLDCRTTLARNTSSTNRSRNFAMPLVGCCHAVVPGAESERRANGRSHRARQKWVTLCRTTDPGAGQHPAVSIARPRAAVPSDRRVRGALLGQIVKVEAVPPEGRPAIPAAPRPDSGECRRTRACQRERQSGSDCRRCSFSLSRIRRSHPPPEGASACLHPGPAQPPRPAAFRSSSCPPLTWPWCGHTSCSRG